MYQTVFNRTIDRILAFSAVIVSFSLLFLRAGSPRLIGYLTDASEVIVILFLLIITVISAFFIIVGRRCVRKVMDNVIENLGHLAKQYKEENKPAAEKMQEFVDEMRTGNHGL